MRGRDFIKAITALSAGWPLTARAQQVDRVRHIGILNPAAENPESQTLIGEFTQRLQELGWTSGRNVRIDFRFGGLPSGLWLQPRCDNRVSPYQSFLCKLSIRSQSASSQT